MVRRRRSEGTLCGGDDSGLRADGRRSKNEQTFVSLLLPLSASKILD